MKLLLDENLPHPLRSLLVGHDAYTVAYMGWGGIENGDLLSLAAANGFDALLTKDLNIRYQQNTANLPLAIVVIEARTNSIKWIAPLVPELLRQLAVLIPRKIIFIR